MKSKLKILIPVVLIVLGATYQFILKGEPAAAPPPKVEGEVYVLPKDFYINLSDSKFARLGVAIVLEEPGSAAPAAEGEEEGAATEPPKGYGTLPQEALVRAIVTDVLTDTSADDITALKGRKRLTRRILQRVKTTTDVPASDIMMTDVAVQ